MLQVLFRVWALLIGILLIMLGNGMHFTLIGLRGGIEGFSATELAIVTSGYFMGFLSGARFTPLLIRRVGHVRVFAALGSFMSAGLIAFTLLAEPWVWTLLRVLIGFCMSGIYVAAESWLNNAATNETRGKVLSAYMIAQTLGIIGAQGLLTLGDAGTAVLFIGASILVSISFAPILLSVAPTPTVEVTRPARADGRGDTPYVIAKPLFKLAAKRRRNFLARRPLRYAIGHGRRLRHPDWDVGRLNRAVCRCAVRRGAGTAISVRLAF